MGLPLAYYLGVDRAWPRGRPLLGVWIGNATALAIGAVCTVLVLCRIDWRSVRRTTEAPHPPPAFGEGGEASTTGHVNAAGLHGHSGGGGDDAARREQQVRERREPLLQHVQERAQVEPM